MKLLFVGERPSHQAVKIGATWQNGKLAAKQLHDALRALQIDPQDHSYINLWRLPDPGVWDGSDEAASIDIIHRFIERGFVVVGMGQIVTRVLKREGIPHLLIVHPAARGLIRAKERYAAHVGSVLAALAAARSEAPDAH